MRLLGSHHSDDFMFEVYHLVFLSLQRYVKRTYFERTLLFQLYHITLSFIYILVLELFFAPLTIDNSLLVAPYVKIINKAFLGKGKKRNPQMESLPNVGAKLYKRKVKYLLRRCYA